MVVLFVSTKKEEIDAKTVAEVRYANIIGKKQYAKTVTVVLFAYMIDKNHHVHYVMVFQYVITTG